MAEARLEQGKVGVPIVPTPAELAFPVRGRLVDLPEDVRWGIDGRIPLPFVYWLYDKVTGLFGPKEQTPEQPPAPTPGARLLYDRFLDVNSLVPYRANLSLAEPDRSHSDRVAEVAYHLARKDWKFIPVIEESDFYKFQDDADRAVGPGEGQEKFAQGYENGRVVGGLTHDHNGLPLPYKTRLRTFLHEKNGFLYTINGLSHRANHNVIDRDTGREEKEYISKAIRALRAESLN